MERLRNIQHSAYRCRDAEQTRWFYEDVLGLPVVAALALDRDEADGQGVRFMHIFFEMADGNQIAFFDEPDHASPEDFDKKHGFDLHVAFEVESEEALEGWRRHLAAQGVETATIDHGFLHSIYFYDPNGIRLEITKKTPAYDSTMEEEKRDLRERIRAWTDKTRSTKVERLGAAAIDNRVPLSEALPSLKA